MTATEATELEVVDRLAAELRDHLESEAEAVTRAHVHGAASSEIQAIVSGLLRERLRFDEEVVLTPQSGFVNQSRTDFFHRLSPGRGVLAEVERGGTTTNNHDLKDFWKTHLAHDAHHLFLIVPMANWSGAGAAREKPFALVSRRLGAFFGDTRREVDVLSAHVFGYGSLTPVAPEP